MEPIQDLNEKKIGVSEYAPKSVDSKLAQLEKDIRQSVPYSYNRTDEPINEIKAKLKLLTHRQMREMCAAIFASKAKSTAVAEDGIISKVELPDVLDRFAHGD
jgi:hypothetical protein